MKPWKSIYRLRNGRIVVEEVSKMMVTIDRWLPCWCTPISPIAISPNQWFWVRVSHPVYIELVLADEMALGEMEMNPLVSRWKECHTRLWARNWVHFRGIPLSIHSCQRNEIYDVRGNPTYLGLSRSNFCKTVPGWDEFNGIADVRDLSQLGFKIVLYVGSALDAASYIVCRSPARYESRLIIVIDETANQKVNCRTKVHAHFR